MQLLWKLPLPWPEHQDKRKDRTFWKREEGLWLVPEDGPISKLHGNLSFPLLDPPTTCAEKSPDLCLPKRSQASLNTRCQQGQGGGRRPPPTPTEATGSRRHQDAAHDGIHIFFGWCRSNLKLQPHGAQKTLCVCERVRERVRERV